MEFRFPGGSASKESTCNAGDLGWEDPLEKGVATHSSIQAWEIPWIEEPRVHGVAKSQTQLSEYLYGIPETIHRREAETK